MNMIENEEGGPRIQRGKIDSLKVYDVTEDELAALEQGSPGSLYLNFSIFLLSVGVSFLVALLTTPPTSVYLFAIFVVFTAMGFVIGLLLLCLWLRERKSATSVSKKIRDRMQTETKNEVLKAEVSDPTSTVGDTASPQPEATSD